MTITAKNSTIDKQLDKVRLLSVYAMKRQMNVRLAALDAIGEYLRSRERLAYLAGGIAERMATLERRLLEEPQMNPVNSLGELQGRGPELDRLCGECEVYRTTAVCLLYLAAKVGEFRDDAAASAVFAAITDPGVVIVEQQLVRFHSDRPEGILEDGDDSDLYDGNASAHPEE